MQPAVLNASSAVEDARAAPLPECHSGPERGTRASARLEKDCIQYDVRVAVMDLFASWCLRLLSLVCCLLCLSK